MEKYTEELMVPSYMVDVHSRMRAVAFMEVAQELAGRGAEKLKFADTQLAEIGAVWVLARMHVEFNDMPRRGDVVTLQTWHKGMKGIQFIRDYQMNSADGTPLALSTSSWLIMDFKERRMLSPEAMAGRVPSEPQCPGDAVAALPGKIIIPRSLEAEDAGTHVVKYSDVDNNGHTNNTKYIMWALDILPQEIVFNNSLSEFDINYNKESHPGETITLVRAGADKEWFVEGKTESGQQCFVCRLRFK